MDEVQLETDRLILRMWREEDFEPYQAAEKLKILPAG